MLSQKKVKNHHFHSKEKGCKVKSFVFIRNKKKNYPLFCKKCITHDKVVCKCGWEFCWHDGDYSRSDKYSS